MYVCAQTTIHEHVLSLSAVIRQDINLTKSGVSGANVASVCGAIFARIAMGSFTDAFGPRMGFSALLSLTSSAGAHPATPPGHRPP